MILVHVKTMWMMVNQVNEINPVYILISDMVMFSVRIYPTRVLASRCYEQAYVSHVDHPSAFFLQLQHFGEKYSQLREEIK